MSYSLVAHATVAGSSGGTTPGVITTGADLMVAVYSWYNGGTRPTLSDSKSNTWTQIGTDQAGAITSVAMYYVASPTVGSGHTCTISGASSFSSLEIEAWSGSAASPFDQTSQAAAYQAGSVTPTQDNELLVAGVAGQDTQNVTAIDLGFTISDNNAYSAGNNEAGAMAYLVETTAAAKNPTWTTPGAGNATATIISTFKAAAGGATPKPSTLPMMGAELKTVLSMMGAGLVYHALKANPMMDRRNFWGRF